MSISPPAVPLRAVVYPESDGQPMAENTKQLRWTVVLFGDLSALYADRPDVFVAANLYWYPVEGQSEVRTVPDVLVVLGRPKGDRGSYKQWEESNVPVTVAFEVLSPGNTGKEMIDKLGFYEEHGVEEYYIYNPDRNRLEVYLRRGEVLVRVRSVQEFVSPRPGIRFDVSGPEMAVYGPAGERFRTFEELQVERIRDRQQRQQAEQRAEHAEQRVARLAELGRKVRLQQANAEELHELERLENESLPGT